MHSNPAPSNGTPEGGPQSTSNVVAMGGLGASGLVGYSGLGAILGLNEAEALLGCEPFHLSELHSAALRLK